MRRLALFFVALAIVPAVGAQVTRPSLGAAVGAHAVAQLLPDSMRIRQLEQRADSLENLVTRLAADLAAIQHGMSVVAPDVGKGDNGADDIWTMLKKLVDRVCNGNRNGCP